MRPLSRGRRRRATAGLICAGFFFLCLLASSAGALPPKPEHYVEDKAGILSPAAKAALNSKLEQFERDSSDQVLVATFPDVPADYQMEDFTQRTAEAWGVGQKKTTTGPFSSSFPDPTKSGSKSATVSRARSPMRSRNGSSRTKSSRHSVRGISTGV